MRETVERPERGRRHQRAAYRDIDLDADARCASARWCGCRSWPPIRGCAQQFPVIVGGIGTQRIGAAAQHGVHRRQPHAATRVPVLPRRHRRLQPARPRRGLRGHRRAATAPTPSSAPATQCVATHPSDLAVALTALDAVVVTRGRRRRATHPDRRLLPPARRHPGPRAQPARRASSSPPSRSRPARHPALGLPEGPRPAVLRVRADLGGGGDATSAAASSARRAVAVGGVGTVPWRLPAVERALDRHARRARSCGVDAAAAPPTARSRCRRTGSRSNWSNAPSSVSSPPWRACHDAATRDARRRSPASRCPRVDGRLKVTGQAPATPPTIRCPTSCTPSWCAAPCRARHASTASTRRPPPTHPDVVRVLTDFRGVTLPYDIGRVAFFGQPVAVVVANTLEAAAHGAALVDGALRRRAAAHRHRCAAGDPGAGQDADRLLPRRRRRGAARPPRWSVDRHVLDRPQQPQPHGDCPPPSPRGTATSSRCGTRCRASSRRRRPTPRRSASPPTASASSRRSSAARSAAPARPGRTSSSPRSRPGRCGTPGQAVADPQADVRRDRLPARPAGSGWPSAPTGPGASPPPSTRAGWRLRATAATRTA